MSLKRSYLLSSWQLFIMYYKGDCIEQLKYLLEEWSLKGGTLAQLEEALLHLDMKHVIPGKNYSEHAT